jgi:hypothetical protein
MTRWLRAGRRTLCGGRCAGAIEPGAPMLVIELVDVQRVRVRCEACAGQAVRWDEIAEPPAPRSKAATFFRFQDVADRFDARAAAARNDQ